MLEQYSSLFVFRSCFSKSDCSLSKRPTYWNAFVFQYVQVLNRYLWKNSHKLQPLHKLYKVKLKIVLVYHKKWQLIAQPFHLYCLVFVIYWCLNSLTKLRIVWKFYFNITTHCSFIFPGINLSITIFSEIFTKNNISKLQGLWGYRPVQVSAWYHLSSFANKVEWFLECFQELLEFESNIFSGYVI